MAGRAECWPDLPRARNTAPWVGAGAGRHGAGPRVGSPTGGALPGRFYLELQRAGLPGQEALVQATVPLAAELQLPVVATHPIQFLAEEDFDAHEARVCVAEGETLANPKRIKRFLPSQHFKTQAAMRKLFADIPTAIANTVEIARRCSLTLVLGKPQLPNFPTPLVRRRHADADGAVLPRAQLCRGWRNGSHCSYPDAAKRDAERPRYVERLEFELGTIITDGLPGLLLIVSDFIRWAKAERAARWARARARVPARWWPTPCPSPTWTRCNTTCCSSAS